MERGCELGEENVVIRNESKPRPGHGCQNSNALNEPLLQDDFRVTIGTGTLSRDTMRNLPRSVAETLSICRDLSVGKAAYLVEYTAELDRMTSSICLHQERRSAHLQSERRLSLRLHLVNAFHLLFTVVLCYVYFAGYVDTWPRSMLTFVMAAEVGWYVSQLLLKIWEWHEHDKRAPGEFCFKFDFQNLPALKELVGEQKWKDMQECSDHIRALEDLNDIISSAFQLQTRISSLSTHT